jgi:ubiquinol-cytochrome c reductase cytochrome b subunit
MSIADLVRREVRRHRPRPVARAKYEATRRLPDSRTATRKITGELDDRLGLAKGVEKFLNHIFPDHWSFLLGEVAMYAFVVLVASGIFLTLYYVPSEHSVVYHGSFATLRGQKMSEAYESVLRISFNVRMGLMMRQVHHWAAEVFIGAIVVHCCRIFFTSAYRRPRELNWCIGVTMLWLAIANGYMGYSILDDALAGSGVRIGYSIAESIPFVGSYLATFIWGGQFPGKFWLHRFYIAHVFLVPLLIIGLLGAHLFFIYRQDHTQWPKKGRREDNVVGSPLWPVFTAKTTGLFFMVASVLCLFGGMFQIEPVWTLGPYVPPVGIDAAQPDWYITWLEGALRLMPSWEWTGFGHTVPWVIFLPAVVFPTLTFAFLYAWPWLEGWFMRRQVNHHLSVAPRFRPVHTAIGASFFSFYFVLFVASGDDVLAKFFTMSLNQMVWAFRIALFAVPAIVFSLSYGVCKDLQKVPGREELLRPVRVDLTDSGAFVPTLDPVRGGAMKEELDPIQVPDALMAPRRAVDPPKAAAPTETVRAAEAAPPSAVRPER